MRKSNPVEPLSVKALFDSNTQYVIPIYQRNYAWGAPEIEQLIQDIYDASGQGEGQAKQDQYYLGSLVVYTRRSSEHESKMVFETIDGQQRHTTLSILLAYLKNRKALKGMEIEKLKINLSFDSRPKSARALADIYLNDANGESEEPNIHAAYDVIERHFKIKGMESEEKLKAFCNYLLENVIILRVAVPEDTDLNHYFEIMNNRGEQLEKHEVLKAKFMSVLQEDEQARNCFSVIWDACADMKRYVQMGFKSDARTAIFGDKWQAFPAELAQIEQHLKSQEQSQSSMTLRAIISEPESYANSDDEEREKEERFGSIIDFSNFLLHVLKRIQPEKTISLDDKKLLDAFILTDGELVVDPREFAFELLKYRILFDRYIIKRDFDEKWSLLTLENYTTSSSFSYLNSFGKEQDTSINDKLSMILAMFHVSNPALVYKRWLSDALEILNELASVDKELAVDGESYLTQLESLSDKYFNEICGKGDLEYDAKGVLHQGTGVQNFVFNRLDYLLWRKLSEGESFGGQGRAALGKHFDDFQFAFRTSVEHYFPQTDPSGADKMGEKVHRFGNLCLISPSSNSRLSNYSPQDKKKFYQENNRAESLKQAIMMSYDDWGPDGKGITNIEQHELEMIEVLRGSD